MKNRAQRRLFRCSPRDLADLRDDDRLKLAGISLPAAGIAAGEVVEAYVSVHELSRLAEEFILVESDRSSANVVLHVIEAVEHPVPSVDSWLLLAADLAEYRRPRETLRAAQLIWAAAHRQLAGTSAAGPDTR